METVFFVGFYGTGKTMMAKLLSARKNLKCIDTDSIIEEKAKQNIKNILLENKNEYLHEFEKNIHIENYKRNTAIALGYEFACNIENYENIKYTGRVIYLKGSAKTIYKNLKQSYQYKYYLNNTYSIEKIDEMLNKNHQIFENLANYTVNIDNKSIEMVFSDVLAVYNLLNKIKCHIYIK